MGATPPDDCTCFLTDEEIQAERTCHDENGGKK